MTVGVRCWKQLCIERYKHRCLQVGFCYDQSINSWNLLLILVAELALFLFHFFHAITVFCEAQTQGCARIITIGRYDPHRLWQSGGGATHWMHSCRKYYPKLHLVHANSFGLLQIACPAAHRRIKSFIQVVNPGKVGISDCHRWYCHVCAQQRCSRSIKSLHSCCASWGKVFQIVADGNWHGKESLYVVCSLLICCSHTRTGEKR
jgi:hypothetical protein